MNAFAFGRSKTLEYKTALASIMTVYNDHKSTVILGKPQLNWCDEAVMVRCSSLSTIVLRWNANCPVSIVMVVVRFEYLYANGFGVLGDFLASVHV